MYKVYMSNDRPYWHNTETNETFWNDPTNGAVPPPPQTRRAARKKPTPPEPPSDGSESEDSDSGEEDSDDDDGPRPLRPGQRLAKGKRGEKQKKALKFLGWNKKAWRAENIPDELEDLEWDDLNRKQKAAAKYLCYDEDSWNEQYCNYSSEGDDSY